MTATDVPRFRSDRYDKKLQALDKTEQDRVAKFEQDLKEQPFSGKPLGYKFFREKKFDGKRLLFLIYEEHQMVFLVTITDKKDQQIEIDLIVNHLEQYRSTIADLAQRLKLP